MWLLCYRNKSSTLLNKITPCTSEKHFSSPFYSFMVCISPLLPQGMTNGPRPREGICLGFLLFDRTLAEGSERDQSVLDKVTAGLWSCLILGVGSIRCLRAGVSGGTEQSSLLLNQLSYKFLQMLLILVTAKISFARFCVVP